MKAFILLICFSFGMLLTMPPGNHVKAANSHQITFVTDVGQVMPAYEFVAYELSVSSVPISCTAEVVQKRPDFKKMYELNYRTCLYSMAVSNKKSKLIQKDMADVHRFARDVLTQV